MVHFHLASVADFETLLTLMPIYYECDHLIFEESKARHALTQFFSSPEFGRIWILKNEHQEAIGYLALTFSFGLEFGGRAAFVDELFVMENYRGKGLGSQAIQYAQAESKKLGVKALRLEVTKTNAAALRLYKKLGFKDFERSLLACVLD